MLTWKNHNADICVKLARVIYLVRRLKTLLTDTFLLTEISPCEALLSPKLWRRKCGDKQLSLIVWWHFEASEEGRPYWFHVSFSAGWRDHCRPVLFFFCMLTFIAGTYIHMSSFTGHHDQRSRTSVTLWGMLWIYPYVDLIKRMTVFLFWVWGCLTLFQKAWEAWNTVSSSSS